MSNKILPFDGWFYACTWQVDYLLFSNLPAHVVAALKADPEAKVGDEFDSATLCFLQVVGLDPILERFPRKGLALIHRVWSEADARVGALGVWKVEHVLSEYLVCGPSTAMRF